MLNKHQLEDLEVEKIDDIQVKVAFPKNASFIGGVINESLEFVVSRISTLIVNRSKETIANSISSILIKTISLKKFNPFYYLKLK